MAECPECSEDVRETLAGALRSHKNPNNHQVKCPGSGAKLKELPPPCPSPTNMEPAKSATCSKTSDTGDPQSAESPSTPASDGPTPETLTSTPISAAAPPTTPPLPGVDEYAARLAPFAQPRALFDQPTPRASGRAPSKPVVPMGPKALEICARIKEMFHAYSNRMDRSQQSTMGPSEAGSPCDRRIAMSLLRFSPVNPGGDNWASFIGTCVHGGLEEMLVWADAGSGRYAAEIKVSLPSKYVPRGTSDLLDRTLLVVMDWKVMGGWSLNKLRTEGPNPTYRVQAHLYAYGARLKGEKVNDVAIVGLPREASSLDDMYVWTEPYNPEVAREALARVDRIGAQIFVDPGEVAAELRSERLKHYTEFPIDNSDCRFCPFHLPGAKSSEGGHCNGRS